MCLIVVNGFTYWSKFVAYAYIWFCLHLGEALCGRLRVVLSKGGTLLVAVVD